MALPFASAERNHNDERLRRLVSVGPYALRGVAHLKSYLGLILMLKHIIRNFIESSTRQCPAICGGRLVDLDSDRRDDRRPFGDLGFDEVAEFFWR